MINISILKKAIEYSSFENVCRLVHILGCSILTPPRQQSRHQRELQAKIMYASPLGELVDMLENFEWGQEMVPAVCNYLNRFLSLNIFNMMP